MRFKAATVFAAAALFSAGAAAQPAANDARASELLGRVAARFDAMPGYTVRFEVRSTEGAVCGEYSVEGDRYHIAVAGNEVYGDDRVRREIDAAKREIVVDAADTASRNILTNPTRAFRFLDGDYTAALVSEDSAYAVVMLTPRDGAPGRITVTLAVASARPEVVAYDMEGERVAVGILGIEPGGSVGVCEPENYEG
ncbi:MAG: hypothetical protein K2J33_06650, partial [Alistipes sp.]|nr:hypothetical protein [Alistipes sp.]